MTRARDLVSIAGALLIVAGLMQIDATRDFPGAWALLPVAGAASLIWSGPDAFFNRRVLAQPLMVWIGLISFQLYLWHWPLLVFVHMARPEDSSFASNALAIAASFPLAWATYAWIDKPVRSGPRSRAKVALACAALAIAGVAGLVVTLDGGFPGRAPDGLRELAGFKSTKAAWREGSCFLMAEQGFEQFGNCRQSVAGSESVVLWGDSHAAHLYPGLKEAANGRFTLTQLTASWCAPIRDMIDVHARPKCQAINEGVFARIARERPQVVILAAYWPSYPSSARLPETIDALLAAGVGRVVVVGPGPRWKSGVPRLLYARAVEDVLTHRSPLRLPTGASSKQSAFDARLAKAVARPGVSYISMLAILCNEAGCLTRTREDDDSPLMFWDIFHLTTEGSRYVVAHFPEGALP
jgi:hypothetical protein